VWDSGSIEDIPATGSLQGVTWAIRSVNRNEDGTFNYSLVKRIAKTQITEKNTQSNTSVEKVEVQVWDNVYGSVGSFTDHSGAALAIPSTLSAGGVKIDVQISKNADCTYKVVATWTTAKAVVNAADSSHTQFEGDHSESHMGSALPLGNAPDAAGGVIKSYESVLQPDGTFKTVEKTKVERPVAESTKMVAVGRRGRRVTVINTNQLNPADATTVAIGGSVKSEKTPGKRYTNTITTWDTSAPVRSAESCTNDIFHHKHSGTTSGIASMPGSNEHVYGSGTGGLVILRQTEMDEEGSISQTITEDQETKAANSEETWQVGLTGIVHTISHRNVATTDTTEYGTTPTYSRANVGKTLKRSKTPGGLYDVTITDIDRTSGTMVSGTGCTKNVFLHTDSSSTNDPNGSVEASHVTDAGNGYYREREARLNSDGSSTVTETTHQEIEQRSANVTYKRTARGLITSVTHRNVSDNITAPAEGHAGDSTSREMTQGGLYNVTTVNVTASAQPDHAACSKTIFEHSDDVVTMGTGAVDATHVEEAGNSIYRQKTSELDQDGFVRTTVRTVSEQPVSDAKRSYTADRFTKTSRVTNKNQSASSTITIPDFLTDDAHSVVTITADKNPGGSIDITTETAQAVYRHWDHEVDTNWRYSKTVWFVNATAAEKDALYQQYYTAFDTKFAAWRKNFLTAGNNATTNQGAASGLTDVDRDIRLPVSYNINPNVTQNKHGLYDGSFTFSANWDMDSAGQTGKLNVNFNWWSYTDRTIQCSPRADGSGSASMTTTTIDRHVYCAVGRGQSLLVKLLLDSGVYFSGTHMDYNPVTQVWHVTLVNSCNIRITGSGT